MTRKRALMITAAVLFSLSASVYYYLGREGSTAAEKPGRTAVGLKTVAAAPDGTAADLPPSEQVGQTSIADPVERNAADVKAPHSDPGRKEVERRERTERDLRKTYEKAVRSLGLSPSAEHQLYSLLIERSEVAYDANRVLVENRSTEPRDFSRAIALAQAEVEEEIKEAFGEEMFGKIKNMINLRRYLGDISYTYDPAMSAAGVPLLNEQVLPLANVLVRVYGAPSDPKTFPRSATIDAAGLTEFDRLALDRAADFLSPPQLAALGRAMAERNRKFIARNS